MKKTIILNMIFILLSNNFVWCPPHTIEENKNEDLMYFILVGDLENVKKVIDKGADVNYKKSSNRKTPLHSAFVYYAGEPKAYEEIIKLLISRGASVTDYMRRLSKEKGLDEILEKAEKKYKSSIIRLDDLLENKAAVLEELFKFIEEKNLNLVKYILNKDVSFLNKTYNDLKPIHQAAALGSLEIIRFLVSKGANVNDKDSMGVTPLHYASSTGNIDIIDFLISEGVDIEAKDAAGATPLHYAVDKGEEVTIKFLISKGANVNTKDSNKKTPLHVAAWVNDPKKCKILIKNGARSIEEDIKNRLPLFYARVDVAGYLKKNLKKELGLNSLVGGILLPEKSLYKAIISKNVGAVKGILDSYPELLKKSYNGLKPLHWAAKEGNLKTVELIVKMLKSHRLNMYPFSFWPNRYPLSLLKKFRADLNEYSNKAFSLRLTPLHYAAENNMEIFEYFVKLGSKVELSIKKTLSKFRGATPLETLIKNMDKRLKNENRIKNKTYGDKLVEILVRVHYKYRKKKNIIKQLKVDLYNWAKGKIKEWKIGKELKTRILSLLDPTKTIKFG